MKIPKPALRVIAGAIPLLAAIPALPQQQPAPPPEPIEKIDKVQVTGTRLPSPDIEGPSPITNISAEDIRFQGALPLESILSGFPQVVGSQSGVVSNGASGTATVDLRGLGTWRNLVLVNGRRLPSGSVLNTAADLNQVPAPLIRRVDILTGGASAVYGSDAIAGVVNFILDNRFEGVRGEVTHGFYNHRQQNPQGVADTVAQRALANPTQFRLPGDKRRDGESTEINLTLGGNFADGKGNGTLYIGYRKDEALAESERDHSACSLGSSATGFTCSGVSTSFPGRFINVANFRSWTVADGAGGVRPWLPATDLYNFAPTNYFRRPDERYNLHAFTHYFITPDAKVYAEWSFHDDSSVAQIAESGLFGVTVTVPYENPLLSPDWRRVLGLTGPGTSADVIVLRRNVEGGGRQGDMHHASHRELVGVSGAAFGHWNYDVYVQRGNVTTQSVLKNDFSITRGVRALDVVVDPRTGNVVCASALNGSDPNCVPYNIWTLGGVTPEALDYLQTPGFLMGSTSQTLYVATLSGDLGHYGIRFPGSAEGPEVVIGAERRSEAIDLVPDVALTSGDLAGSGGATPPVSGSYVVKELFGETRVPVTDDLRFTGSFRHSNYSTGKSANTYGIGVDYSPVRHARIRGSYQRAIRAPDIFEAFSPQVLSGLGGQDPCAGENPGRSLAECARTGVTAAQYGHVPPPPEGIGTNLLLGGNPNLGPETGKTLTLGVVLEPMPDLSVSIDYYDIRVTQAIGTPPPNIILMQCADTGDPFYCALIRRDPVAGSLWLPGGTIDITLKNQDALTASGVDVALRHGTGLGGMGRISFEALGTYARKVSFDIRGAGSYDCAGLFGPNCGRPRPRWRHRLLASWKMPWDVELAATWRYIGAVLNTRTDSNPLLAAAVNDVDRRLSARSYLDLALAWAVSKNFTLTAGVNNLLDRDPPLVSMVGAGFANGNTYPVVYDALGRRIFARLTARF